MEILHVYTQSDLDSARKSDLIPYDVYIHGGQEISMRGIKEISGYLGFSNVDNIDLNDIEVIGGDLWVSTYSSVPESIDLRGLRRVGGSLNLNNTPISSLGRLEYVGGNVCLRDTNIADIGNLSYIGGNFNLPKEWKDNPRLLGIEVHGDVKFYKPRKQLLTNTQRGLTPSERPIPVINPSGCVGEYVNCLENASLEQQDFYNYFKECFYKGILLDVKGYYSYPKFLIMEMLNNHSKPLSEWLKDYDRIVKAYPQVSGEAPYYIRWKSKDYALGWELCKRKEYIDISEIGFYEEQLSRTLFDVEMLLRLPSAIQLSPFGKQHLDEIIPFIREQLTEFEKKWKTNFLHVFVDENLNRDETYDFYKQFYVTEEQFNFYNGMEYGKFLPKNYDKELPHVAVGAIMEQCKTFTSDAEDLYRESIGMPKIGEYWRSETELYYSIKEAFKETEVKQHASPRWLGLQHLDVYLPEYNIGLEYQGIQHYKPVDFFGGEEAFIKGQERDARKKHLCDENGCILIYVNEGYDLKSLIEEVKEKINDK